MSLIIPDELPTWVPGRLTVCSPAEGWHGLSVRGYRYAGSDVAVPPMRDYMIVAYRRGATAMRRRVDGEWASETLRPGDVSLLTRAAESHWAWPEDIEVVHVYLTKEEMAATCRQMYERDVEDVELLDEVKADDPAIHAIAMAIAREAAQGGAGSRLLVDSLSCQLAVHILRQHAHVLFREPGGGEGLTYRQERTVRDYVEAHLSENISLDDLAASVALSRFHFARMFRQSVGTSPHEFVLQRRLALARSFADPHQRVLGGDRGPLRFRRSEPHEPGVQEARRPDPRPVPRLRPSVGRQAGAGFPPAGGRPRQAAFRSQV